MAAAGRVEEGEMHGRRRGAEGEMEVGEAFLFFSFFFQICFSFFSHMPRACRFRLYFFFPIYAFLFFSFFPIFLIGAGT